MLKINVTGTFTKCHLYWRNNSFGHNFRINRKSQSMFSRFGPLVTIMLIIFFIMRKLYKRIKLELLGIEKSS